MEPLLRDRSIKQTPLYNIWTVHMVPKKIDFFFYFCYSQTSPNAYTMFGPLVFVLKRMNLIIKQFLGIIMIILVNYNCYSTQ